MTKIYKLSKDEVKALVERFIEQETKEVCDARTEITFCADDSVEVVVRDA